MKGRLVHLEPIQTVPMSPLMKPCTFTSVETTLLGSDQPDAAADVQRATLKEVARTHGVEPEI